MPNQLKKNIYGICFALLLTIIMLGFIELIGGALFPQTILFSEMRQHFGRVSLIAYSDYLPFTTPSSRTVWFTPSNGKPYFHVMFNSFGYRGSDPATLEKPTGTNRILLLGDSFVLGWGLDEEDTISAQMKDALKGRKQNYEVINAGYHDGYSPDSYYAYLRKEGMALKPDVIVQVIYTGNDVLDVSENIWTETDELGGPRSMSTTRIFVDYNGALMNPKVLPWNYKVKFFRESRLFLAATNVVNRFTHPEVNLAGGRIGLPMPVDLTWQHIERSLVATSRFCKEKGIPLVFVSIPFPGQALTADLDWKKFRKIIQEEIKRPWIALHEKLNASHRIPDDGHTNRAGNQVVVAETMRLILPYLNKLEQKK